MRNFPRRFKLSAEGSRFRVVEFRNPSGDPSYRVSGWTRQQRRIRENYPTKEAAFTRRVELENEFLRGHTPEAARVTTLDSTRLRCAELAFVHIGDETDPMEIVRAARYWIDHGRAVSGPSESPRLDDAVAAFARWLTTESDLRHKTQVGLRSQVGMLPRLVGNPKLGEITPDLLDAFFAKLKVTPVTKDCVRRALSRFFSWCMERPRRWLVINPASSVKVLKKTNGKAPPSILTLAQCEIILRSAEGESQGRLVPWFSLGLFGGLRPTEARRLAWVQINLHDEEIRLEGEQTKTGDPRVLEIGDTLKAWLTAYRNQPLGFSRRVFRRVIEAAGVPEWTPDILRHTAATAHLRQFGSYAETARQFGNSEAILKRHYEGRMSSAEAANFYALRPTNGHQP